MEDTETSYFIMVEHSDLIYTKNKWVYVEKKGSVPANIDKINLRVGVYNNYNYSPSVTAWFDNLSIRKANNINDIEIVEENNYYPFGLKHRGYNDIPTAFANIALNKMYNGKELQEELNFNVYDYHARMYDPVIGRMLQIDPHAVSYGRMSPYNYAFNNPILVIDPNGKDGIVTGSGTEEDPYVIKANYYYYGLNKDQAKGFKNSIASYNNKGKTSKIKTENGNIYVKYNLSATEVANADEATKAASKDYVEVADGSYAKYGNTVSDGPAGSSTDLGDADRSHINLDSKSVDNFHNSPNPQSTLADVYEAVGIHEIGHNIGGVHGDPGRIMLSANRLYNTGSGLNQTEQTTFSMSKVSSDGTRAIIGRMNNQSRSSVESQYLSDKETKNLEQTSKDGRLKHIN